MSHSIGVTDCRTIATGPRLRKSKKRDETPRPATAEANQTYPSSPPRTRTFRGDRIKISRELSAKCKPRTRPGGRNDAIDGGANFQGRVARSQPSFAPSRPARSEVAIVSNSRACPYRARVPLRVLAGHPPDVLRPSVSRSHPCSRSRPRSLSHAYDAPTVRTTVHHSLTRVPS